YQPYRRRMSSRIRDNSMALLLNACFPMSRKIGETWGTPSDLTAKFSSHRGTIVLVSSVLVSRVLVCCVLTAGAVHGAMEGAECRRFFIVYAMRNWFQGLEVRKNSRQVLVRQVGEHGPRHGLVQFAGAYNAGSDRFDEHSLIVIRNARGIRG